MIARACLCLLILTVTLPAETAFAHGSVTPEDDICIIEIGYYSLPVVGLTGIFAAVSRSSTVAVDSPAVQAATILSRSS